jgi:hypothetical protein
MTELDIWTLWSSNRIGNGLYMIAGVLSIWLALRVAASTRASEESNIVTKILASIFGVITLMMNTFSGSISVNNYIITSGNLNALTEKSETATGFIEWSAQNFGTEIVSFPGGIYALFSLTVLALILGMIWTPKK